MKKYLDACRDPANQKLRRCGACNLLSIALQCFCGSPTFPYVDRRPVLLSERAYMFLEQQLEEAEERRFAEFYKDHIQAILVEHELARQRQAAGGNAFRRLRGDPMQELAQLGFGPMFL